MPLTNDGEDAAEDVAARIVLPDGLAFAAPAAGAGSSTPVSAEVLGDYLAFASAGTVTAGDWTCELADDRSTADCSLDTLAAGGSTTLSLGLAAVTGGVELGDDAWTEFSATTGEDHVSYRVRTTLAEAETELPPHYDATGRAAAVVVGAPLLGCNLAFRDCERVMDFRGSDANSTYDNNSQSMRPLNLAGGQTSSSETTVDADMLPPGSTVVSATLSWSANRGVLDSWSAPLDTARLRVPGGDYVTVTADDVETSWHLADQYYQATADITEQVAAAGTGAYALADVALPARFMSFAPNYYAGFAITIVYEHADLPEATVLVLDGTQWLFNSSTQLHFLTEGQADIDLGVVAWEGDRGKHDDRVAIDSTTLTPWGWSGSGRIGANSGNAMDSTAFGSPFANSLGTDAKHFKTRGVGPGVHTIELYSGREDAYLLDSVIVTITPRD